MPENWFQRRRLNVFARILAKLPSIKQKITFKLLKKNPANAVKPVS